jgi:hypothetical protein
MAHPFHRAATMMALIAAAMRSAAPQAALAAIGPYKSRGKGGKRAHCAHTGAACTKRAAIKKRNVQRNRRAHK